MPEYGRIELKSGQTVLAAIRVESFADGPQAAMRFAHRLAAAPELLAAAREAIDWRNADGRIGTAKESAAFSSLDAAIAAAEKWGEA